MKILHNKGFTQKEKLEHKKIVYCNTIDSLKVIIQNMSYLKIQFADSERKNDAKRFFSVIDNNDDLNKEIASIMKRLWLDIGTQMCFDRSREYQLHDSAK